MDDSLLTILKTIDNLKEDIEEVISETTISMTTDGIEKDLSEEGVMLEKEDTVDASVE